MATFDILLVLLLGVIVFGAIASIANYLIGGYHLLSWMKRQRDSFRIRGGTTTSENEQRAIQETLIACDQLQKTDLKKWKFKFETISLIEKISSIYHPNSTVPIEQARLTSKQAQEGDSKNPVPKSLVALIAFPLISDGRRHKRCRSTTSINHSWFV